MINRTGAIDKEEFTAGRCGKYAKDKNSNGTERGKVSVQGNLSRTLTRLQRAI